MKRRPITDFGHLSDKIDVLTIDAKATLSGNQAFSYIGVAASFTAEGQIRATQSGADTFLWFNTTGSSGTTAEMTLRLQNFTASTLTASDFVL